MKTEVKPIIENMLERPFWYAAFRPFFFLSSVFGVLVMLAWPFVYYYGVQLPGQANTMNLVQWHAYHMLYGFILAALAGFIFTSIPEFTNTSFLSKRASLLLVTTWVFARIAFYLPGVLGAWLIAIPDVVLVLWLLIFTLQRLDRLAFKKYYDFVLGLLLMLISVVGYHFESITGEPSLRWVRLTTGAWMMLIIVALGRISMRIVNDALEKQDSEVRYISRPPRRHLALLSVFFYTMSEFFRQPSSLSGWLALAAAAAIFNILNDWHLGKEVIGKWTALLYGIYLSLGIGYGLLGLTHILNWPLTIDSAARHIMFIGGISVAVFMVFSIAGRFHSGRLLDERKWVPIGVVFLIVAAVVRAFWGTQRSAALFSVAVFFWVMAFSLSVYFLLPVFTSKRPDGKTDASG